MFLEETGAYDFSPNLVDKIIILLKVMRRCPINTLPNKGNKFLIPRILCTRDQLPTKPEFSNL